MKKKWIFLTLGLAFVLAACDMPTNPSGGKQPETPAKTYRIEGTQAPVVLVLGEEEYSTAVPTLKAYENDAETAISYTVSDPAVVEWQSGKLEAKGAGMTSVTATAGDQTYAFEVNVLEKKETVTITDETAVKRFGRTLSPNDGVLRLTNTASGFEVNFIGTSLSVNVGLFNSCTKGSLKVIVDGTPASEITFPNDNTTFQLAEGLENGLHTVQVRKMTEQGYLQVDASDLVTDGTFLSAKGSKALKFEFFGDSITSGYGNLGSGTGYQVNEDGTKTYASMLAEAFDAEYSVISYAGVPACLDSPNATFNMLDMYDKVDASCGVAYDFASYDADLVVINLGTNDSNDTAKTADRMAEGYATLLRGIRAKRPDAVILCVYGMMGVDVVIEDGIIGAIDMLTGYEGMKDIFFLELDPDTSGGDGHPVVDKGHKAAAELIGSYLIGRDLV